MASLGSTDAPTRRTAASVCARIRPGASATPEELIEFCRGELAAYKYPRHVEVLPDLPKTPTGKLLRRELRQRASGD